MKGKIIVLVFSLIVLFALLTGVYYWKNVRQTVSVIDSDTAISGDYSIKGNQTTVIKNGATFTVNGDLKVKGKLVCDGGPLNLVVKGDLVVDNLLECDRKETDAIPNDIGSGISLVVEGSIIFNKNSTISSNGSIQIVDSVDLLAKTQEEIDQIYREVESGNCEGQCLGTFSLRKKETALPLSDDTNTRGAFYSSSGAKRSRWFDKLTTGKYVNVSSRLRSNNKNLSFLKVVSAQGGGQIKLSGSLKLDTPPKGLSKQPVMVVNAPSSQIFIQDYTLTVAPGRNGTDSLILCDAKGSEGYESSPVFFDGNSMFIDNFILELGDGGNGGNAETSKNCRPTANATGGNGAKSGRYKIAAKNIEIKSFFIVPGKAGDGGWAKAFGGQGGNACPGGPGSSAVAKGGKGADNAPIISFAGLVDGLKNVKLGIAKAGNGGDARAEGGQGGNGTGPGCKGGGGGKGIAVGGFGGNASSPQKDTRGGDGGSVEAFGGKGGNGGKCVLGQLPGGDGGWGGDAESEVGKAGSGNFGSGSSNGRLIAEQGGDGGNGGDGYYHGSRGRVGEGVIPSLPKWGEDGKGDPACRVEIVLPPEESFFDVFIELPSVVSQPESTPPPTKTGFRPLTCEDVFHLRRNVCKEGCEGIGYGAGWEQDPYPLQIRCILENNVDGKSCDLAINPATKDYGCRL